MLAFRLFFLYKTIRMQEMTEDEVRGNDCMPNLLIFWDGKESPKRKAECLHSGFSFCIKL